MKHRTSSILKPEQAQKTTMRKKNLENPPTLKKCRKTTELKHLALENEHAVSSMAPEKKLEKNVMNKSLTKESNI